jgi:transcriptional regulator with XRE-family HTH domain
MFSHHKIKKLRESLNELQIKATQSFIAQLAGISRDNFAKKETGTGSFYAQEVGNILKGLDRFISKDQVKKATIFLFSDQDELSLLKVPEIKDKSEKYMQSRDRRDGYIQYLERELNRKDDEIASLKKALCGQPENSGKL